MADDEDEQTEPATRPVRRQLWDLALDAGLERPVRPSRYDPGERLELALTGVCPATEARATFTVEKFVGGGFAGQVYRARLDAIEPELPEISAGDTLKLKILKPPSGAALAIRNALFWLGYQGCYSAQVHEAAARGGALWQTILRRGAKLRFGRDGAISPAYATFWDDKLLSYGEVAEWVEGRQWRYELDDRYFQRGERETTGDGERTIGPPEYLAKRRFMAELVRLLHDMGAPELARQYEWWTCKSQPNALKRDGAGDGPGDGLTAIDFRAGLTLVPFLPMSPADVALIWRGLKRGALVQFDRGDLGKLEAFVAEHAREFEDLEPALEELREVEPVHRESLPDVTHHGFRLLADQPLRQSVAKGAIGAWQANGLVDAPHAEKLQKSRLELWIFALLGALPFLGKFLRKTWGDPAYRRHARRCLGSFRYLRKALRVSAALTLIGWHRDGRIGDEAALELADRPTLVTFRRLLFGWLPPTWQRFCTDGGYAWECIREAFRHPWKLLFDPEYREQWLEDQIQDGMKEGMLTEAEGAEILAHVHDPFIQRYLKACAVHVCTLPVTQVVSLAVALWVALRYGQSWGQAMAYAGGVLLAFQVVPVSPGSIVRGGYAVYVGIRDRELKRYRIAIVLSFFKYVGYLAFPIQMVAEFPQLAQFMAGRWATGAVRIVPVFGERGALLEHAVFDLFFNVPLSLRRKWRHRRER